MFRNFTLFTRQSSRFLPSSGNKSAISSSLKTIRKMIKVEADNSLDLSHVSAFREPEFIFLNKLFQKYGHQVRVAGGAVRDVLMAVNPKDIDLATTATPEQMVEMFTKENIRMLNRNGEAHGTVTVRINDTSNFEVTTLRIDVNPDGRHSEVAFTTDWKLDASRRDLTVNSMFLSIDYGEHVGSTLDELNGELNKDIQSLRGTLYDYFNGLQDLSMRNICFVGDPAERIKEDYLRILRYFRFHGRLAPDSERHDEYTLKAISENSEGLRNVAGERIWMELKQILLYPSAPSLLRHMSLTGVCSACGLPSDLNLDELDRVWSRGILELSPNPAACLAATMNTQEEADTFIARVRPSNAEVTILKFLIDFRAKSLPPDLLEYFKHHYLVSFESSRLKPVFEEAMRYLGRKDVLEAWNAWVPPKFPINGHMLQLRWNVKGRILRPLLQSLKESWVASGCQLTAEDLLSDSMREQTMQSLSTNEQVKETLIPPTRRH
ncbi:CCA tRNA nucleotidyltransferase 1, mitochondrial [Sparganum proliferum]